MDAAGSAKRKARGRKLIALGLAILATLGGLSALSLQMRLSAEVQPDPESITAIEDSDDDDGENDETVNWDYWKGENDELVGWIRVEGTTIDLPIVQASAANPTYYLTHDIHGNWNYHGCPYVDASNGEGLDAQNVVIFGHNLIDGSMFTQLEQYHDFSFAQSHRDIALITQSGTRNLMVAGSATIAGWEKVKRTSFVSESDYREYAASCLEQCDVLLIDTVPEGPMVTLCTCSYFENPEDERTLIYAFDRA